MNVSPSPGIGRLAAIERALAEIDAVIGSSEKTPRREIPFYGPTLLASMNQTDQALAHQAEHARYEEDPEESAIRFCLTSAVALLEVSQFLLNQGRSPTPQEQERHGRPWRHASKRPAARPTAPPRS